MQLTGHSSLTQSNPSEYRQHPPTSPSNGSWFGLRSVLLLGQWEGVSGRSLCRKGFTPVKMTPKFPRKTHWRAEVSRDSLSHHELWAPGGDSATKAEGAVLQVRRAPLGTCVPASSANLGRGGGRCLSFHHGSPAPLLLQVAQGKPGARQKGGQVWDVLWSSCHLPPTTTQLRAREEQLCLCTYVTHQTDQRSNVTTISINKVGQSQPWGKQKPSHWL